MEPTDISNIKKELLNCKRNYGSKPSADISAKMEENFKKLRVMCMIPGLAVEVLNQDIQVVSHELAEKLVSGNEFDKRTSLVAGLVNYFSNLSNLNNNEKWRPLFRKKRVGFGFLDLCTKILNKNNEATQVIPALKALSNILDMKLEA